MTSANILDGDGVFDWISPLREPLIVAAVRANAPAILCNVGTGFDRRPHALRRERQIVDLSQFPVRIDREDA